MGEIIDIIDVSINDRMFREPVTLSFTDLSYPVISIGDVKLFEQLLCFE